MAKQYSDQEKALMDSNIRSMSLIRHDRISISIGPANVADINVYNISGTIKLFTIPLEYLIDVAIDGVRYRNDSTRRRTQ